MSRSGGNPPSAPGTDPPGAPIVAIDARMVGPRPIGIARFVMLLARGLASLRQSDGLDYRPVFLSSPAIRDWAEDPLQGFDRIEVRAPFLHAREQIGVPFALRRLAGSGGTTAVYHSPSFSSLFHCPVPWIATVHDLIHLHFGSAAQRLYYRSLVRPFVRRAAARTTVSEHSRQEIAKWARMPESSIEVVHTALDPAFATTPGPADTDAALARLGLDRRGYFFCLSNPKPHKNVGLLVEAYREYRRQRESRSQDALPLVINIGGFESVPGVRRAHPISEADLPAILAATAGFFFPSRSEGFGLPPLEAAVMGAPVVVSRIPPLVEAFRTFGEDEVNWLEPLDREAWARMFHRATDGSLNLPGSDGRERARAFFTAERLGRSMDRVYRGVLPR